MKSISSSTLQGLPTSCLLILVISGCTSVGHPGRPGDQMIVGFDYLNVPSVLAESKKITEPIQITDAGVYTFATNLKEYMDIRKNQKGVARKVSGTTQVATAAIAATLAALEANILYVTAFAAFSALMPELQNIFQAREGSATFRQGSEMIGNAVSEYIGATVDGKIPSDKLTAHGKNLHGRVQAAIVLVDKALLQLIPTKEQLAAAGDKIYWTTASNIESLTQQTIKAIKTKQKVASLKDALSTAKSTETTIKLAISSISAALTSVDAAILGINKSINSNEEEKRLTESNLDNASEEVTQAERAKSELGTEASEEDQLTAKMRIDEAKKLNEKLENKLEELTKGGEKLNKDLSDMNVKRLALDDELKLTNTKSVTAKVHIVNIEGEIIKEQEKTTDQARQDRAEADELKLKEEIARKKAEISKETAEAVNDQEQSAADAGPN